MASSVEKHEFQTETKQLLDLMIHSVYSHKEIFLRELISNASDALDKLKFEAIKNTGLSAYTADPHIRIEPDSENRTLTVHDNGVGMGHDELISFLGTIAKSGSQDFLRLLQEAKKEKGGDLPPELIGQFGVGFYSSFMVADRVTVLTRRAGEEQAWRWESAGDGAYTIEATERDEPGTSVTLHLRPSDAEDALDDYTQEWTIRGVVKKYSDFVAYPIRMKVERTEVERDEQGRPKEGAEEKKVVQDEVLNSMKAIWRQPESEVTEEEYAEFYKHISHDWNEPLKTIPYKAEGRQEFRALLFLPSKAPFDLFMQDSQLGIQLYIKRVFIMNDCKQLLPEYLRFVRGVVDSEDLPLNISREMLQNSRQIEIIRKSLVRKVLDEMKDLLDSDREKYTGFWGEFGKVIREGLFQGGANRERLLDLCLFRSTEDSASWHTLDEYIKRMKPGQEAIYYMTGESLKAVENSPHLEAFKDKGYEVLLLTDPVDEVWVQSVFEFKEKKLVSAGKGMVDLESEEEKKEAEEELKKSEDEYKALFESLQEPLSEYVKEVRLSSRLTSSPVCLVSDEADMTPQLEQMLRAAGQDVPAVKRILELNPKHSILTRLKSIQESGGQDETLKDYAELLYGQAVLAEGGKLPDPGRFSKLVADLMVQVL